MSFDTRLFVGNLPVSTSDTELLTVFSSYGKVKNVDLKSKTGTDDKKFAFITLTTSNANIETCIQNLSTQDFNGNKLYVTRARESFLERLQRERQETAAKNLVKDHIKKISHKHPVMKLNEKLNPRKRQPDNNINNTEKLSNGDCKSNGKDPIIEVYSRNITTANNKNEADKKRLESLKKKRQEFKEKQQIIKTGLFGIDKVLNKKKIFSDDVCDVSNQHNSTSVKGPALFDDEDSDNDMNFEVKKQFEGKKGQKILELQSRFKSDKRFKLDERFTEEDHERETDEEPGNNQQEEILTNQFDEKTKQLNILQNVLSFSLKTHSSESIPVNNNKKQKSNLGMLRFDPMQPEHAKFLAPFEETKQDVVKKNKKKKSKDKVEESQETLQQVEKVEVSKETFYEVTDTLKKAITQPNTFSLRSLFSAPEEDAVSNDLQSQEPSYIPLDKAKSVKVKNPLDHTAVSNPFKYDSSESETEDNNIEDSVKPSVVNEVKAVWKEKLFFSATDSRLQDGLAFFNKPAGNKVQKDRREMKSVMKKRLHNKERKDQTQMFKKKIGGKRKAFKKSFRRKF